MGGKIIKIYWGYIFEKESDICAEFVKYFGKMRIESVSGNVVGKIIINSLFGRFGMKARHLKTIICNETEYLKHKQRAIVKEIIINRLYILVIEVERKSKLVNSNVGIASAITAKARIKL
jgi:hypothetical protein